jgi:excisionase family DNA binding protein
MTRAKQLLLSSAAEPSSLPDAFDGRLTISIDETSAALGVGRDTVYVMIGDGRLVASKFGTRTVVHVASIRNLLAATRLVLPPRARVLQRGARASAAQQAKTVTP